jgi:translocation and assembly module TamB
VRGAYLAGSIDISQFQIVAGQSQIDLTAHYDHAPGNLRAGNASFHVNSSRIDLAHIRNIQMRRPGLGGTLQITGHGDGTLREGAPQIAFRDLSVNVDATGIRDQNENFGDLKLAASQAGDNKIDFALDSNLAGASIHGRGAAELTAGYPLTAQLSFNNILYSHIAKLMGGSGLEQPGVEAAVDGQASVTGPALDVDQLRATLQLTRMNITANSNPGQSQPILIANQGPVTLTLDHGSIQVQNAHISGSQVDVQVAGSASLPNKTLALTVNAKIGLGVLPNFDRDIYSSGDVSLDATVRGTISQPVTNGQVVLRDAAFNYSGMPNGISNANGTAVFSGTNASIRNLTAESGGGQLTITGFAQYSDTSRFGLRVKATHVRTRVQEGASIVSSADLQVAGTSRNSVISGTAVIDQVNYNPQTDIALLLSRGTPQVETDSTPTKLLQNMRLDVRVRTSSGLAVRADIAQGVSATADLRLQGTVLRPGVRGLVTVNEGTLVFFGSSYKVDNGTITFYNPLQIEPILDISLETETQGVNVVVRVTGPIYNLKLSYTSNPPLQFQEIVGLLAGGRTPTSDPTLLANQPQVPQSSFGQMGESAALGEAVTNPMAGRLQRVFGISQLKVDPAFQGGSEIPTARLELQQRISNNLTFTYTSALDDPNGEIVKIEWAFDPKWSAVATRDQNGIFSVNFLYKRQFR